MLWLYKFKRLMHIWVLEHIRDDDSPIGPPKKAKEIDALPTGENRG
jgi:hypothetical protein